MRWPARLRWVKHHKVLSCCQVPMEVFGLMQQIYNRAQHSLGPDVGCYAPPKLWENELNESLQVQPPTV